MEVIKLVNTSLFTLTVIVLLISMLILIKMNVLSSKRFSSYRDMPLVLQNLKIAQKSGSVLDKTRLNGSKF